MSLKDKFKKFEVPPISRNPKLAYIFFKTGLVEERGIGMKELKAFKDDNSLPSPTFRMDNDYFIITIFRKKMKQVDISPELVIDFIKDKGEISSGDYATHFGVATKTASRHLNKLVDSGIIDREGEKRGTKYFLKK